MKKHNLLKTVLLLLFSVFLLHSCRTDIENNVQKTASEQPYSKLITLDNLNIELSSNYTYQKSKVSSIIKKKTLLNENFKFAEDIHNKDFITSIDTKNIVKVEKSNGLKTYTLNVKTKDNRKVRHFYQLILIAQNNNFDYRLIKYIPSDDFNVSNIKTENFRGEIIVYNIDGIPNNGSIKMGKMEAENSTEGCVINASIEKVWEKCSIHGFYSPNPEHGCDGGHWEYQLVINSTCSGGSTDDTFTGWNYNHPTDGPSGGGGSGSGSFNGSIPTDPTYIMAADLIISVIPDLSPSAQNLLYTHPDIADLLARQLVGSPVAQDKIDFVSWAANFFVQNPTTSQEQFKNWFMGESEGKDGEYVESNLIEYESQIVKQNLPSLAQWYSNFPKVESNGYWYPMSSPDVYKLAGGSLYNSHLNDTIGAYQNACAIRGSRALLYSGITIPILKKGNLQLTQKGGDNKNYILAATSFLKFMKDTFGETSYRLEGADANDAQKVADFLKGKNGIYVIENADPRPSSQGGAGYSGHVDAIVDGICISGAYTKPKGGVKSIRVWVLN